jgi:methyl-accepting chemotaxis protein
MSSRTKISVETLDDLRIALDLSGTSIQGFEKGMRTLVMRVDDARKGNVEFIETFAKLGLSVTDFEGLKPDELFMRVAGGLAGVTDTLDQQAIAVDLLGGKFGTSLLPALENGEQGFRDLLVEAGAMSNWTDEQSQMAEDLADDITELNEQINDLQRELAVHLVPALIDTVTATNDYIDSVKDAEIPMGKLTEDVGKLALLVQPQNILSKGLGDLVDKLRMLKIESEATRLADIFGTVTDILVPLDQEVQRFANTVEGTANVPMPKLQHGTEANIMALDDFGTSIVASGGFLQGLEHVISDIDEAQDQLDAQMQKTKDAVDEQTESVIVATKSWIDYHKAIGGFQSPDAGGGGSIYDEFPSMMSPQGQMALYGGVMGLASVGGDPAKAHAWLNKNSPFNTGNFTFPTNQGSSNVVLTNIAQINAGINDAKTQGVQ